MDEHGEGWFIVDRVLYHFVSQYNFFCEQPLAIAIVKPNVPG